MKAIHTQFCPPRPSQEPIPDNRLGRNRLRLWLPVTQTLPAPPPGPPETIDPYHPADVASSKQATLPAVVALRLIPETELDRPLESIEWPDGADFVVLEAIRRDKSWPRASFQKAFTDFSLNDDLDACDKQKKWYEAVVIDINLPVIKVHFKGWDSKWGTTL